MSSQRRRHSGPPSPLYSRRANHDDYFQRRSGPPPAYMYTSFDDHGGVSLPVDYYHGEPSRGRRPSRQSAYSDARGRGYDAGPPPYAYDQPPRARRPPPESRSQGRTNTNDRDGPRGRPPPSRQGRDPCNGNGNGNGKSSSRSKSLSSPSQPKQERRKENTGTPWWQNQIVRTCAATALSTGLSAALDSRHDPGQWKGAKGTKVAVATVGSALVDGFLGQKHPDGVRHKVMKKGMEVAMDEAEKKKHQGRNENKENKETKAQEGDQQRRSRSRSTGRHRSSHHGDERRHRSHGGGHRRRR